MNRLSSIQALRGIAAMMVVWHHALAQIPAFEPFLPASHAGANGVDLFFVISGFIMVLTTEGRDIGPAEFLRRRIVRIVPLYWLFTGLVIVVAWLAPRLMRSTILTPEHALLSLLFVPHPSPSYPQTEWPILVPGWTLNLEMFFYALFAAAMAVRRPATVALVVTALVGLVAAGALAGPFDSAPARTYTSPMLLQFGLGALLGRLHVARRLRMPKAVAVAAVVAGFALLLVDASDTWRISQTTGAVAIVAGALHDELVGLPAKWLDTLGDASYSIYLSHIPTLGLARALWQLLAGPAASPAHAAGFMLFALTLAAAAGVLVYRFVEMPMLRSLMRLTAARPSPART